MAKKYNGTQFLLATTEISDAAELYCWGSKEKGKEDTPELLIHINLGPQNLTTIEEVQDQTTPVLTLAPTFVAHMIHIQEIVPEKKPDLFEAFIDKVIAATIDILTEEVEQVKSLTAEQLAQLTNESKGV